MLKRTKTVALIFYIIGFLYLLYTLFTCYTTIVYVQSVLGSDYYATIRVSDIVSVFVGQIGPFLFYTCMFFAMGYIIQLVAAAREEQTHSAPEHTVTSPVEATPELGPGPVVEPVPDFTPDADYRGSEVVELDEETPDDSNYNFDDSVIDLSEKSEAETQKEINEIENGIAEAIDNAETTGEYGKLENIQEEQKEEE